MSSFDKRVCQWLNGSSLPVKSKQTILSRMNVGISNYHNLEADPNSVPQIGPKSSELRPRIDYSLQDHIAKALSRLRDCDEGCDARPLFSVAALGNDALGLRLTPRVLLFNPKSSTPRSATGSPHNFTNKSSNTVLDNHKNTVAAFEFGVAHHNDGVAFLKAKEHDEDYVESEVMGDEEHQRRNLTRKRQSRHAVSSEPVDAQEAMNFVPQVVGKSAEVLKLLTTSLQENHLFSAFDDSDIVTIADMMLLRDLRQGEQLVQKGDPIDTFFVVVAGSCQESEDGASSKKKYSIGSCVGELGLMYETENFVPLEAVVAGTQVCTLNRQRYKLIAARASQEKRLRYEGFLSQVKFLKSLSTLEKLQLADSLKSAKYTQGEKLISFGEPGHWFSIILEGTVNVIGRDEFGKECHVCSFTVGDCVGELEFLFKHSTVADVVAATAVVRTAKMTSRHFEKVIGPAREILERQAQNDEVFSYYRQQKR